MCIECRGGSSLQFCCVPLVVSLIDQMIMFNNIVSRESSKSTKDANDVLVLIVSI